jgi:two-component system OmpR family response regulator
MGHLTAQAVDTLPRPGWTVCSDRTGQGTDPHVSSGIILLIEDDVATRHVVTSYLAHHDMDVIGAADHSVIASHLSAADLVILNPGHGHEGLAILCRIRSRSDVPVIITASHCDDETEKVVGLELGADDYLSMPFSMRELLARIRAVLRRPRNSALRVNKHPSRCLFSGWELDRKCRRLTNAQGCLIKLTKGEYALLVAFIDAPQRPLTREHLLQATRTHEDVFDRSIDVQVLRLRRKLEIEPSEPKIIKTERGVGYVFDLPVERRWR